MGSFQKALFHDLSLSLPAGRIVGLLGKNGAGKTTLLKLLSGLLFPASGACRVLNHTPSERQADFLSQIFFLPEEYAIDSMTIRAYQTYYSPFYPAFCQQTFNDCLALFELSDTRNLETLSHGERKKVLIAFGLATHAKLLILDEPTNGLDIPSKSQFQKLLAKQVADDQLILISTHQVHDVENLIDDVVILDGGKILFHESMMAIAQKLKFLSAASSGDNILYQEPSGFGIHLIAENLDDAETSVQLDLLFNAVMQRSNAIHAIFKGEKK